MNKNARAVHFVGTLCVVFFGMQMGDFNNCAKMQVHFKLAKKILVRQNAENIHFPNIAISLLLLKSSIFFLLFSNFLCYTCYITLMVNHFVTCLSIIYTIKRDRILRQKKNLPERSQIEKVPAINIVIVNKIQII